MYFSGVNPISCFIKAPKLAWSFYVASGIRVLFFKFTKKKLRLKFYGNRFVKDINYANNYIKKGILAGKPFMYARYGSCELFVATQALLLEKKIIKEINVGKVKKSMLGCGLFPEKADIIEEYNDLIIESSQNLDLFGTFRMIMEDYYIKTYMPRNVILSHLYLGDFWLYDEPFTMALKGKKVLVVHPLVEQIRKQYNKRELLFDNPNVLPEFELLTFKAYNRGVSYDGMEFNSFFEALDYMTEEILKMDFDVALLGCGAYGLPLSSRIKKAGKTAIYLGGVTQVLFGIKGKRWSLDAKASKLYNEHWVNVDQQQAPSHFRQIEDGCYW